MAPVSISEHVSVIDQLKDSFDATPDVDQLHDIHSLREEIASHCDSSEDRIKSIIKGELAATLFSLLQPVPRPPPSPSRTSIRPCCMRLFLPLWLDTLPLHGP